MIHYKGYTGKVEFDEEARLFHGEIVCIRDVVTFQGTTVDELEQAFRDSVEDYLEMCREMGKEPDKPYSGRFMVRVPPDLHRSLAAKAEAEGVSLNSLVRRELENVQGVGA